MFSKILVANRGAIACRILRTLDRMGIAGVAVYSEADRHSRHVHAAAEAVCIGPAAAAQSYLDGERIIRTALETGAQAIHPGYGFLSENPGFAEACEQAGLVFIGPNADQMRAFGLKHTARELAQRSAVPLSPGSGLLDDVDHALSEAAKIGYPVMLKSTAGGGGIGLQLCRSAEELPHLFETVTRLARNNFKEAGVYLEKYVERGRHIEVQVFGDGKGRVVALGERDCSAQRRNQKVVEETPAPGLPPAVRQALFEAAVKLGEAVTYRNAGTVEFLYDTEDQSFSFLEVNTRLQVEHGVTEEVLGIDLVEWMIRQAAGEVLPFDGIADKASGHSIQVRLYAEDPNRNFRPSSGLLSHVAFAPGARVETWVESGSEVSPFYDPMIAKIIVTASDRPAALAKLQQVLADTSIAGIETNIAYLRQLAADPVLGAGGITTRYLDSFVYRPNTIEVTSPGTQTTVQDWPGRVGYWAVGVPPSGPMDPLAFRLANRVVGNPEGTEALEITVAGPTLTFHAPAIICLAGPPVEASLNGAPMAAWVPVEVPAGSTVKIGTLKAGTRAYLAVRGGFDLPDYLGSKSTFTLGKFGGHGGRSLLPGDVLHLGQVSAGDPAALPAELIPAYPDLWEVGVLYGPHGAPDFFTDEDIAEFFAATWEVHYNSNRTGIRLIGPRPKWARKDGGEAGLHPSNIHDNAYAIGTVDFTGDMPVILGVDGPSLGGFVCPATIIKAELWKMGQLRPGAKLKFRRLTPDEAARAEQAQDRMVASFSPVRVEDLAPVTSAGPDDAVLATIPATASRPRVVYRRSGDKYLLVEYGPLELDLTLRFRVHALMEQVEASKIPGIVDLTPGIRSLQLHYDSRSLPLATLLSMLETFEQKLPAIEDMVVPTRIVNLPLSWDDEATQLAIRKYMQSVRPDAPWCPSNIEFIRRINGLSDIEEVKQIVFGASYLVLGLGDVYLGAPVATPVDPRHRLVTTKYNPARTWTPENAVGIGGAYMCVYGMEGPGGYQFVGRTCQVWNTHKATTQFAPGRPWLLRFFDQIRFHPVSGEALLAFRDAFLQGRAQLDITEATFSLAEYTAFLKENAETITAFKTGQQAAFEAERARWEASGQIGYGADMPETMAATDDDAIPDGTEAILSPVPGSVWKISVEPGQSVKEGDTIVIVESMKMEIPALAPCDGTVLELRCAEGRAVGLGQVLGAVRPH